MVKKNSIWFLPVLAFALICMGQTFAQESSELTSLTVAEDKAGDKDACDKGCTFVWGEDSWLTVGAGLRVSYRKARSGVGTTGVTAYDNNFNIDNARIYLNGRGHDCLGMEFNTDIDNAQGFWDFDAAGVIGAGSSVNSVAFSDSSDVRILDAIVKFEFNDLVNIWMGRMLPPSDRTNLSGPYYMNSGWDFPFVQFGYNNIFQGRDDGAAIWGQLGGGAVKYQVGAFEGTNGLGATGQETQFNGVADPDALMIAGRFTVNLLDPEPGYYNASTYHGEKDILALGYAFQNQTSADAGAGGVYRAWNFDVLYETTLGNGAVATIAGAYYDFVNSFPHPIAGDNDGTSWFVEASYLTAREFNLGACVSGRIAPFWRHQEFRRAAGAINRQTDYGFHYVMFGHNARATYVYSALRNSGAAPAGSDTDQHIVGVQLQY